MSLRPPAPQAIVIFGASGDLARRKIIPALYNLARDELLPTRCRVIGFARTEWSAEEFRAQARASIQGSPRSGFDEETWKRFASTLSYVSGSFDDPAAMARLAEELTEADARHGCEGGRLYYLAVPPSAFSHVVQGLGKLGANTPHSRIVVEKPFGHSVASARDLTREINEFFDESQLFRIDHYLGKETVQNLTVFRFANSIWERVWNRDAIDHVQLTVAEPVGVEGRAGYYEEAGAIRDLLQNHMLQVLSYVTMEPPRSLEDQAFRDEKVKLLRTIRPIDPADVVRAQYTGYRDEEGVDPDSKTETFVAARLWIDNWRWEDVPFFVRHGKKLPKLFTELTVAFRRAPDYLFQEAGVEHVPPNHLTVRIQPDEGISLAFQAKDPGPGYDLHTVRMDFDYERTFKEPIAGGYERLLHDAMLGDQTLFTRADDVERSWEIVTPALEEQGPLFHYEPGTWGPSDADELIAPRRWHMH
jgi:glucose-6-phosphate 1-dehydrogenase